MVDAHVRHHPSLHTMGNRMHCSICDSPIDPVRERVIVTTDGLDVHMRCADSEATRAWATRQFQALAQGGLILALAFAVLCLSGSTVSIFIVLVLGGAVHYSIHCRWWMYYAFQVHLLWRRYLPRRRS